MKLAADLHQYFRVAVPRLGGIAYNFPTFLSHTSPEYVAEIPLTHFPLPSAYSSLPSATPPHF